MVRKNPWIAAILNVVVWGLGYLYLGKRTTFGVLLVLGEIVSLITTSSVYFSPKVIAAGILPMVILSAAFAYDAYQEAQR